MTAHENRLDVEDVSCFLTVTSTLVGMLTDKCLAPCCKSIQTNEVMAALNEVNSDAYDLVRNYNYIADTVRILEDRILQAVEMLDAVAIHDLEVKKITA